MVVKQFEVYLGTLDPTICSETQKTRPCVIISPNEMNNSLSTVFIVPLTSTIKPYPTRLNCTFDNKNGQLALDQMRAVDKVRLIKKLGAFKDITFMIQVTDLLRDMFTL